MTTSTAVTVEHPRAQTVLILSIVGIFVGICAPIAWYLGAKAKKEVLAQPGVWTTEGSLKMGTLIGKIFTIIYIVAAVLWLAIMIIGLAMMGTTAHS
jgi:hypothetical protein